MGCRIFTETIGGYYLCLLLPEGSSNIDFARAGAKGSIFIAPGTVFSIDTQNPLMRAIRLNVAHADDQRFYGFLLRSL